MKFLSNGCRRRRDAHPIEVSHGRKSKGKTQQREPRARRLHVRSIKEFPARQPRFAGKQVSMAEDFKKDGDDKAEDGPEHPIVEAQSSFNVSESLIDMRSEFRDLHLNLLIEA